MRSYGHDVTLPVFLYFVIRATWRKNTNTRLLVALYVFVGCVVFELAQVVGLYPGTFDSMDFVFYGFAVALAIVIDMACIRDKKSNTRDSRQKDALDSK